MTCIGPLTLRNPICVAAGPMGMGDDLPEDQWQYAGAFFTQSITLNPRTGNTGQVLFDSPAGIINRLSLPNPGLDAFLTHKLPNLLTKGTPIFVSIAAETKGDYATLAERLQETKIAGIELNVSCPNLSSGYPFHALNDLKDCLRLVRTVTDKPLTLKISAIQDIWAITHLANECGIDALSMINTVPALTACGKNGGLSGPAIKPIAMLAVARARSATNLPIIGIGGISRPQDVRDFFNVGATAVAVGSALLTEPCIIQKLIQSLS